MAQKRNRRPFGSIRKLPSGNAQARWQDVDGRPRSGGTFETTAEADLFLATVQADRARGQWVDPAKGRLRLGEWADRYMASAGNLKPKTRSTYQGLLDRLIRPAFADAAVADITVMDVRSWVGTMTRDGKSASQVRQALRLLSMILKLAVEAGMRVSNPCANVRAPKVVRRELRVLTPAEVTRLAREIGPEYHLDLYVFIGAYGGLRDGENRALRRSACNILKGRLVVTQSLAEVNGEFVFGPTKTHQSREVQLPKFLVAMLSKRVEELAESSEPDPLLFTGPQGGPLSHSALMWRWRRAAARAGVDCTPHGLRATCASWLIDKGASPKDVQAHLGHADAALTLNLYTALMAGKSEVLATALDGLYQSSSGT